MQQESGAGRREKVLIVKVGYSETLDPEIGEVTSYGDVLRSTVLLNAYKDAHVTWLVDEKAYPIIRHNRYIDRPMMFNLAAVLQLQAERFDTVINLEKVPGLCALADKVNAWRRFGFRFDAETGSALAYDGSHHALSLCQDEYMKAVHTGTWQQYLYEMIGKRWAGEEYVFGRELNGPEQFDIGFNHKVGTKWPEKSWPMERWKELEALLGPRYSISWQEGLNDMEDYFRWIQSCRMIITNDSFGLHIGIALKKKVIGLFGPTNPLEVDFYQRGIALVPSEQGGHIVDPQKFRGIPERERDVALIRPEVVACCARMFLQLGDRAYQGFDILDFGG